MLGFSSGGKSDDDSVEGHEPWKSVTLRFAIGGQHNIHESLLYFKVEFFNNCAMLCPQIFSRLISHKSI